MARMLPVAEDRAEPQHRLLQHLNPEQLAAVTLPAVPALILAGAGSARHGC
jgi:DNA helicase-2/ATP-dependent DNA helicase PcrA